MSGENGNCPDEQNRPMERTAADSRRGGVLQRRGPPGGNGVELMRNMQASYAMDVRRSRGRRYPEAQHPYRDDYARDRDRVIHARAFRRLEAKTQVFSTRFSDHFRNRLTHTLEVAQIARTVADALRPQCGSCGGARSGSRHRPSAIWPRGRKTAGRAHARAWRAFRPQSPCVADRRAIRTALRGFPRPESHV